MGGPVQRAEHQSQRIDTQRFHALAPVSEWVGFPASLTSFWGREQEVADVSALVQNPAHRLVTLLGPGGIGKTRLALAVAEHVEQAFPGGAAFISLASVIHEDHVPGAVAAALGVVGHPGHTVTQSIVHALQGRRFLLILDNLEHLAGSTMRRVIQDLLDHCPLLTILATSREPLHLALERRYLTPPLSTRVEEQSGQRPSDLAALHLFVARAEAVRSDFTLGHNDALHIGEICRRLDGLPLAIELAAAWMRLLSPAVLRERLQACLPLLTGGPLDQPARFQTMRAAIAWSFDLLCPEEAAAMRRLSVFRGGFTLEGAADVIRRAEHDVPATEWDVLHLLGTLCDKSLLHPLDAVGPMPRFGMLETVREFAHDLLAESGELEETRRAHATLYRDLAERIEPILLGPAEDVWLRLYDDEMGNVREALSWGLANDPELALRLSGAMGWFWTWYHLPEGQHWLAQAIAATPNARPLYRARALIFAMSIAILRGDEASLSELMPVSLEAAEDAESAMTTGHVIWLSCAEATYTGDCDTADAGLDRALTFVAAPATPSELATAAYIKSSRGDTAFMRGNRALGINLFEEALQQLRTTGGSCIPVIVFSNYAGWLLSIEMVQRAREVLQEAVRFASTTAVTWQSATTLTGLALADALEHNFASAARRLGALEAIRIRADLMTPFYYQARIDEATQLALDHLGRFVFAREWEAGYADPVEVVVTMREDAASLGERSASTLARDLGLTRREFQVLALVAAGHSDRDIAARLCISVRTASKHVGAILVKLGVTSRAEAAVRAMHLGLA